MQSDDRAHPQKLSNFAGADLSQTDLPDGVDFDSAIKHLGEISKRAQSLHLIIIGACVFSWLTIATTTDAALLSNATETPLPIIQTKVPMAGFYWFAPVILLATYVYFHFYLQRMWDSFADLPAVFPGGQTVTARAYPWMLTSLTHVHMPVLRDRSQRPAFSAMKVILSVVSSWCMVPLTLCLFWARYVAQHDMIPLVWLFALFATSIYAALVFYMRTRDTLRAAHTEYSGTIPPTTGKGPTARLRLKKSGLTSAGFIVALMMIPGLCTVTIDMPPLAPSDWRSDQQWYKRVLFGMDRLRFLDVAGTDISTKPADWSALALSKATAAATEIDQSDRAATEAAADEIELLIEKVKEARLGGMRLDHANAKGAFLVKADLGSANLVDAMLDNAVLTKADLKGADLTAASLRSANLARAELSRATLAYADLLEANLNNVELFGGNLTYAILSKAKLANAELQEARLMYANLSEANLTNAELPLARLTDAFLTKTNLTKADLSEADLTNANLSDANLASANLREAILANADLRSASLRMAIVDGADLRTRNLTQDQLSQTCFVDVPPRLPPGLTLQACHTAEE